MAGQTGRDGHPGSAQNAAILLKVAQTMSKLGIAPLPRNYELFYEALFGQLSGLSKEVAALGAAPAQARLDQIGMQYNLVGHSALAADKARAGAAGAIAQLSRKLRGNIEKKEAFSSSLQAFMARIEADPVAAMSDFADDAARFGHAAAALLRDEKAFALSVDEIAGQFNDAATDLDASRKALTRDPVTGLPNRTAFSARLCAVFDAAADATPSALILVTIDGLQDLGNDHGDGPVEKILKKLAPVFRKSIKKNDFVARIANDEFAFVFTDVSADNAETITERIRASVEAIQIALPGRDFTRQPLSLSAGIAMSPSATGAADLFQQADLALKAVRTNGGAGQLVFSAAIGSQSQKSRRRFVA